MADFQLLQGSSGRRGVRRGRDRAHSRAEVRAGLQLIDCRPNLYDCLDADRRRKTSGLVRIAIALAAIASLATALIFYRDQIFP